MNIPQIELPAHRGLQAAAFQPQFADRGSPPASGFFSLRNVAARGRVSGFGSGAASRLGFAPRRHVAAAWARQGKRKREHRSAPDALGSTLCCH